MYQIEGKFKPKCGSLDRIGFPDLLRFPLMAQLLLPMASGGWGKNCDTSAVDWYKFRGDFNLIGSKLKSV